MLMFSAWVWSKLTNPCFRHGYGQSLPTNPCQGLVSFDHTHAGKGWSKLTNPSDP
jgi:hypothetical protein